MRFYIEPEFKGNGGAHPSGYRLRATGPGIFYGDCGVITDAVLAHLVVDLLNGDDKAAIKAPSD